MKDRILATRLYLVDAGMDPLIAAFIPADTIAFHLRNNETPASMLAIFNNSRYELPVREDERPGFNHWGV